MNLSELARRQLRGHHHAVLGTISLALPGYPFASVVRYVLDARAWPVMLMSRLAEHTRNIAADARTSLLVHDDVDAGADVQAGARITLMGQTTQLTNATEVEERYFRYFPRARSYRETLDFDFYRIEPVSVRAVAGFARVHWVSREAYSIDDDAVFLDEASIIDFVNAHWQREVHKYCERIAGAHSNEPLLVGVDCEGFDIRSGERLFRVPFEARQREAAQAQQAVIASLAGGNVV